MRTDLTELYRRQDAVAAKGHQTWPLTDPEASDSAWLPAASAFGISFSFRKFCGGLVLDSQGRAGFAGLR
jgi:hypothetical protein